VRRAAEEIAESVTGGCTIAELIEVNAKWAESHWVLEAFPGFVDVRKLLPEHRDDGVSSDGGQSQLRHVPSGDRSDAG
jgi:hypothetical protein